MAALERKQFYIEAKVSGEGDGPGYIEGYGNVVGNVDRASEIVAPGAYKNLAELVKSGAGLLGHEWEDLPIATLEDAREDPKGLYFKWQFHSTASAQEARTVALERIARGKNVFFSIGYRVLEDAMETRDGQTVRILKAIEVYEISLVNVPANPEAMATDCKTGAGVPLDDQVKAVLESFDDLTTRLAGLKELRGKLSESRQAELSAIVAKALDLIEDAQTEPVEPAPDAALLDLAAFAAGL